MSSSVTRELVLEGLDCANCATKIENQVNHLQGVNIASLNFMTKTLKIEMDSAGLVEDVLGQTYKIINTLEPDVRVGEKDSQVVYTMTGFNTSPIIIFLLSAVMVATALVLNLPVSIELMLYLVSYLLVATPILKKAGLNIIKGQVFDENFLMSLATLSAFAIKQYPEAVAVMLFYRIGEFLQDLAVHRSRQSISSLMDIRPEYATRITNGKMEQVKPEEVVCGDIIVIKPGERIPLDGIIIEGSSSLDTSALTGESLPRYLSGGDEILAGYLNIDGLLKVEVSRAYQESTVTRILHLVENAASHKAPAENFITRFAAYYTPVVVFAALALALIPPLVFHAGNPREWVYRALVFLVISCPCALVISVPLSFFAGIGKASRHGILVKGSNYLEALNYVNTMVFDKTGTLTTGNFKVVKVNAQPGIEPADLLYYAAAAEYYSQHPLAISIRSAYSGIITEEQIGEYQDIPGYGIKAMVMGREVLAGSIKLIDKENIIHPEYDPDTTQVHIAIGKTYAGYIELSDQLKPDVHQAMKELREMGMQKLVMFTGDKESAAHQIAAELGLDEIHSGLLPQQKVEMMEILQSRKSKNERLAFVGDGINDAPVLARSDLGIAMGGLGSDAAIEAADIVIMNDEPGKLPVAVRIARDTRTIVIENIVFALGVKAIVLALGAVGLATMWQAVFADVGVTIIAVINSLRLMRGNY
ncbi:MAG: heavy metal translocating P-type ATPase [Syntrophomonadaceae bacterium]|nr:heavy metal translocating P-type ATPase [Syntrophomonadaceae bacterium]MDD4561954.1 heavy metal translocating P-type ATPase [Syntrophomonadaceae bacterium]